MDQLLLLPEVSLPRQPSGAFFAPVRARSTCSGDIATDSSSTTTNEEVDDYQSNSRRISLCKQVLAEATTKFNAAPLVETPLFKSTACRNSGALLPLLSMLGADHQAVGMVRYLDTLSFLLLDRANRRACHELRAMDVLLDILRRATDQQVLLSALEALCCLCKHDARDKMSLWSHPNKGALLSMLSNRHGPTIIVETLRTCRTLCFAAGGSSSNLAGLAAGPAAGCPASADQLRRGREGEAAQCGSGGSRLGQQAPHSALQLLEPALLTVASELLHPSTDAHVLLKSLKLLHAASALISANLRGPGCCGCWHNAVFRIVPLLTHCGDVDVVEAALAVLVNLAELDCFHNMFFASGCIPPLLHLLSHKRCAVSQSASCVLSALAEGGLSRDKLCQDTALLAMLRVLHTNHCVVVTLGVLYMLGRLAAYRGQVVRSLKGWGAIPLLLRLMAATRDEDATDGCRQLLARLGVQPPASIAPAPAPAPAAAPVALERGGVPVAHPATLHAAYSSIMAFGGAAALRAAPITGVTPANGPLCRTISAAATVAGSCSDVRSQVGSTAGAADCGAPFPSALDSDAERVRNLLLRPRHHNSFRFFGGSGGATCGPMGPIAAAVAPAAAY